MHNDNHVGIHVKRRTNKKPARDCSRVFIEEWMVKKEKMTKER